jgi:hypothetical protein
MKFPKLSRWQQQQPSAGAPEQARTVNDSPGTADHAREAMQTHANISSDPIQAITDEVRSPATNTTGPTIAKQTTNAEIATSQELPHVDLVNVLTGIAWLGEVQVHHVQRVWFPDYTSNTAWLFLQEQIAHGFVKRRPWYVWSKQRHNPIRKGHLYSLTQRAIKELGDEPQFPLKYLQRTSKALINHDIITTELIVKVIELGRLHGLSGIYLEREVRLDPHRPRPVMDAILILRRGGEPLPCNRVPWTNDPRVEGERVRRYAVENDRDSEAMSVIVAKAHAYQAAGTQAWLDAYGQFPIPLWIVPTQKRKVAIMRAWAQAWPNGKWLIATDEEVQQDRWTMYFKGELNERRLFD